MRNTAIVLKTYTGENSFTGEDHRQGKYPSGQKGVELPLLVVKGSGPSLCGRDWLSELKMNWQASHQVLRLDREELDSILEQYEEVVRDELGLLAGVEVKIHVDAQATPRFYRPRNVPHTIRQQVEEALCKLVDAGIVEPVRHSEWAALIVPILKADGSIRVCGDYKMTVNQVAKPDSYPLPRINDLLARLGGAKVFSKLDMSQAYQQLALDEQSKPFVTINTHKGLFQYNRLPFGVSAAPAIFQRTMENLLQGIEEVVVYLDDILVTGKCQDQHLQRLEEVLQRLSAARLRLKRVKCQFMVPSVQYLGVTIDTEGTHPNKDKVRAIQEAPAPTSVKELKAFLGLLNYYSKFLHNISSVLAPLYKLLKKGVKWHWGKEQETAFKEAKRVLISQKVLIHYDARKPLILACDASPVGIGAVLSHQENDGSERPIALASRTLTTAEQNYAQIEREGLAVVFGVTRFQEYIYGRHFTLVSDHKPLQTLFNERNGVSEMASARIQRWALKLSGYHYTFRHKPGIMNGNADGLSRLPLRGQPDVLEESPPPEVVSLLHRLEVLGSPVSSDEIKRWTREDPVLARVLKYVLQGWPANVLGDFADAMKPYKSRVNELSVQDGCVLWGARVLVPEKGRQAVLTQLHDGHPGFSRMKVIARTIVW